MSALQGRIALVTGASRGTGAAVAKRYAAEGAQVILAGRDRKGLEATNDAIRTASGTATLAECDLSQANQIERLAAQTAQRFGRLDILVGNAAQLGELAPLPHIEPEDWDRVISVNLTANWQLIRCFDALLKLSDAPRAIFVTSDAASAPFPYWGGYAVSKAALEMLAGIYAAENAKTALRVNLVDPGEVRTRMNAQAFPGADPMRLPPPEDITDLFVELASLGCKKTGGRFYAQ